MAGVALFIGGVVCSEVVNATPERPAVVQTEPTFDNPLKNYQVAFVDNPGAVSARTHSPAEVMSAFNSAGELLGATTDGKVTLPKLTSTSSIKQIEIDPTGSEKGRPCYTQGDLLENLPTHDMGVFLTDTTACGEDDVPAWNYWGDKATFYGPEAKPEPELILHEIGHVLMLTHHTIVGCEENGSHMYMPSMVDIADRLRESDCGISRDKKGKIDEYASWSSVMGGTAFNYIEPFDPVELNKIMPKTVEIPSAPSNKFTLPVKVIGEGVRGFKMPVPIDHPLRNLDAGIDTLTITAKERRRYSGEAPMVTFLVTAVSGTLVYDIETMPFAELCTVEKDCAIGDKAWSFVYSDKTLNTYVAAERTGDDTFVFHVTPLDE
jgi:hypothetical protein